MKVVQVDGAAERQILVGMVCSRTILARLAERWKPKFLGSTWANVVAEWCVDYFRRYGDAPKQAVGAVYERWAETAPNAETAELVGQFIETILDDADEIGAELNPEYILDVAGRYLNELELGRLCESVQRNLQAGQLDEAADRVRRWSKVEIGAGAAIDVLRDVSAIRAAFEDDTEPLIEFRGALGEFFGRSLSRGSFVGFMAPDKRGKSFVLQEVAYCVLLSRRRVLMVETGDMTQSQILRRMMVRIARVPFRPGVVYVPKSIRRDPESSVAYVERVARNYSTSLSWRRAIKACERLIDARLRTGEPMWRLVCYPAGTLSVSGIRGLIVDWERTERWVPDVIVIDYADLLAAEGDRRQEYRHQQNEIWKRLRALSQEYHALVVTASQTDAAAYKAWVITRSNFSEDKRKLSHVTGMIGINQTAEEGDAGVIRLNWVVRRDEPYSETRCVYCATCFDLANPFGPSCW